MVNVLQITSNIKRNGPAAVVMDLTSNYPDGYRAIVASSGGELESIFAEKGVKCIYIPIGRTGNYLSIFINFFKTLKILNTVIKKEKIDIIHCHQPVPILFGTIFSKIKHIPIVTTAHNIYNPKSIVQRQYSKGDIVAAVSEKVRRDQIDSFGVKESRVVTVLNGIDASHKDVTLTKQEFREEVGLNQDSFVICTVAGLRKQKALDVLLKAASIVTKENEKIQFLIAGNGEEYDYLISTRDKLGLQNKVIFCGFRNDIYNILNASEVFCLSSDFEGLPISILEAMVCGKPVVSTDVGGVNEVVIDGITGILCPKRDYEAIANAIIKLSNDKNEMENYSQNALKEVSTTFSASEMARKYCAIYKKLLGRKK